MPSWCAQGPSPGKPWHRVIGGDAEGERALGRPTACARHISAVHASARPERRVQVKWRTHIGARLRHTSFSCPHLGYTLQPGSREYSTSDKKRRLR